MVTPIQTTSSAVTEVDVPAIVTAVDVPADVPSIEINSASLLMTL